jgi:kynurenine formamidase
MADLQVYQYDSTKLPADCKTYTTPDMGNLYETPAQNEMGEWAINSNMVMVDCSHPWGNDQPTWPAGEQPYMKPVQYMSKFNRRTQLAWGMPEHVSTQYDAPSHCCQESPFVHEVPLKKFIGPAVFLDIPCKPMELITVDRVKEAVAKLDEPMQKGDQVFVITGWHRLYSDSDRYFIWSPGVSREAGLYIRDELGASAFGVDTQALDHPLCSYMAKHGPGPLVPRVYEYAEQFGIDVNDPQYSYWEPCHEVFLSKNLPGYEDVGGDVDKVLNKRCVTCSFPSRWYMGDGSKVRIVAFIDKDKINDVPDRTYKYGTY